MRFEGSHLLEHRRRLSGFLVCAMDDDEDSDTAVRRRAREIPQRTAPTARRRKSSSSASEPTAVRRSWRARVHDEPVVSVPPCATATRPPPLPPKEWNRSTIAWQQYTYGLEEALRIVVGTLQTRHDSAEQRTPASKRDLMVSKGGLLASKGRAHPAMINEARDQLDADLRSPLRPGVCDLCRDLHKLNVDDLLRFAEDLCVPHARRARSDRRRISFISLTVRLTALERL